MKRDRRTLLLLLAAVVAVVLIAAGAGIALSMRDDDDHSPRLPGRIAVRAGCGLTHMWQDGTDVRRLCLTNVWDAVSLSWNGEKLAWDTVGAQNILTAPPDGEKPDNLAAPAGANVGPSLSPDSKRIAFLHSPRDDGRYDIWVGSASGLDAEQVTTSRNISDVVWSPRGDKLAFVRNWSADTLEGQIVVIGPDGKDERFLVNGDAPDWSPDGKQLTFVHGNAVWTIGADGRAPREIAKNGHAPSWSRDGKQIAFLREEKCPRPICKDRVILVFTDGSDPRQVGPTFPTDTYLLWLPDPNE
jgi:Tol biopolymer transport system component